MKTSTTFQDKRKNFTITQSEDDRSCKDFVTWQEELRSSEKKTKPFYRRTEKWSDVYSKINRDPRPH